MNEIRDPQDVVLAWLEEGPRELPAGTRSAIAAALPNVRRAPAERRLWPASRPGALLAVAAGVAAVVLTATLLALKPALTDHVAAPVASPTRPIPTLSLLQGDWLSVGSARFGYQVELPADWRPEAPVGDLPPALFPGTSVSHGDLLRTPGTKVPWLTIAITDLAPRSLTAWTAMWDDALASDCTILSTETVTVAGASARLRARTCQTATEFDVLVPHGAQVVLFRWVSDGNQPIDDRLAFDRILASFRFSHGA